MGGLGLKSCDHVQVRCDIWNLLSLKIDHGTEKGTNSGDKVDLQHDFLPVKDHIFLHCTDAGVSAKKRER